MDQRILNEQRIEEFRAYLQQEEKSEATIDKYIRDARAFCAFSGGTGVTKELETDPDGKRVRGALRKFHACQPEQSAGLSGMGRLQGKKPEDPAPDLLSGGKGTDQGGISAASEGCQRPASAYVQK